MANKIPKISFNLWLMHNYLTAHSRLKYRRCQPQLSTSLLLFTFSSESLDIQTKQLQFLLMIITNTNSDMILLESAVFIDRYRYIWCQSVAISPVYIRV